ncbi:hypothetical protein D623_10019318 [Myotis brandtii]|uniref:Uncharacterized protein n=1 Tax=Myotis brandtii TaxID=109478 RepID=S7PZI7_MYOBR|nr:hypothetical protein D623_10019318 [Myotis brandtii]
MANLPLGVVNQVLESLLAPPHPQRARHVNFGRAQECPVSALGVAGDQDAGKGRSAFWSPAQPSPAQKKILTDSLGFVLSWNVLAEPINRRGSGWRAACRVGGETAAAGAVASPPLHPLGPLELSFFIHNLPFPCSPVPCKGLWE